MSIKNLINVITSSSAQAVTGTAKAFNAVGEVSIWLNRQAANLNDELSIQMEEGERYMESTKRLCQLAGTDNVTDACQVLRQVKDELNNALGINK